MFQIFVLKPNSSCITVKTSNSITHRVIWSLELWFNSCTTNVMTQMNWFCRMDGEQKALNLVSYPVDTGRKLNVHKTFRRRPGRAGRFLNVLCTFNLRPVFAGYRNHCQKLSPSQMYNRLKAGFELVQKLNIPRFYRMKFFNSNNNNHYNTLPLVTVFSFPGFVMRRLCLSLLLLLTSNVVCPGSFTGQFHYLRSGLWNKFFTYFWNTW